VKPDQVEFHFPDGEVLAVESSHAPDRGDLVNIRKVTYCVIGRTYTVDHAHERDLTQVVCIVNLADPAPTHERGEAVG
jgi:hypothetical protein